MKLDQAGIDLLCFNEGFRSKPYLDSVGKPTIGIGTTILPDGSSVTLQTTPINEETALMYMDHYLEEIYAWIRNNCKWSPNQNQFNALCSFLYNLGLGNRFSKCVNTKRAIINGDLSEIILGMDSVNNNGLLEDRREREISMFETGCFSKI